MATRAALTVVDLGTEANSLAGVAFTGVAGVVADGHKFLSTGKEFVVITKSGTSGSVTFQSNGKVGADSVADRVVLVETTDAPLIVHNFPAKNFKQADGSVYVDYESAEEAEFTIQVFKKT